MVVLAHVSDVVQDAMLSVSGRTLGCEDDGDKLNIYIHLQKNFQFILNQYPGHRLKKHYFGRKCQRRYKKEKVLAVATSRLWQDYQIKKQEKQLKKLQKI